MKEVAPVNKVLYHETVSPTVSRSKSSEEGYYGKSEFLRSLPFDLVPLQQGVEELIAFYKASALDASQFVY